MVTRFLLPMLMFCLTALLLHWAGAALAAQPEPAAERPYPADPVGLVSDRQLYDALTLLNVENNESTTRWIMNRLLPGAMERGYYSMLEEIYISLSTNAVYSPSGRQMVSLFYDGIENIVDLQKADDWQRLFERIVAWQQAYPESVVAPIVHAMLLEQRAWAYRGNGPARNVSRPNMKKFEEFIDKADAYLEQHKVLALHDPQWYAVKVKLLRVQGKADAATLGLLLEQASVHYPHYDRLQFNVVLSQFPNWGGSAQSIDSMIALILTHQADEHDRQMMYTRMYWIAMSAYFQGDFFTETQVDWPRMKLGFKLIIADYPDDWNLNHFAAAACLAGDFVTMAELMPKMSQHFKAAWFGDNDFYQRCVNMSKA